MISISQLLGLGAIGILCYIALALFFWWIAPFPGRHYRDEEGNEWVVLHKTLFDDNIYRLYCDEKEQAIELSKRTIKKRLKRIFRLQDL